MFLNHDMGAVHRFVQKDIEAKYKNIDTEVAINGGRADIVNIETKEVWELKPDSVSSGASAALECLVKYIVTVIVNGEEVSYKTGEAEAFTGEIIGADLGNAFNFYYNIRYHTPLPGVVLYDFDRDKSKHPSQTYEPSLGRVPNGIVMGAAAAAFIPILLLGALRSNPIFKYHVH